MSQHMELSIALCCAARAAARPGEHGSPAGVIKINDHATETHTCHVGPPR